MEPYFTYFKQQWVLGNIDEAYISNQVTKGRLTQEEADTILATPRAEVV